MFLIVFVFFASVLLEKGVVGVLLFPWNKGVVNSFMRRFLNISLVLSFFFGKCLIVYF